MLARLHRVKQEHKVELLSFPLLIFLHDGQVQLFLFEVQPLDQRPEKQPYFLASLEHKHPGGRQPKLYSFLSSPCTMCMSTPYIS